MIEIYTDGSYYRDNRILPPNKICGGIGIVMRYFDKQYKDELLREEYYAYRYTYLDLLNKIDIKEGIFQCFENVSSTLVECIGLSEGINLIKDSPISDGIKIYIDDAFLKKMVVHYRQLINSNLSISDSKHNGCILCMIDELFQGDKELLNRIEIYHVNSHRDNVYNNMADCLASYRSKPLDRIIDILIRNTDIESIHDRKQYFLQLQNFKNPNHRL